MKHLKNIFFSTLILLGCSVFSQEKVTTLGIQLKPIIPIGFIGNGKQTETQGNVEFQLKPKAGLAFGMVIRKGITKNISIESGINLLRRNYDLQINDIDSSFSGTSNFRLINYEIPIAGLVYVQLGEQLFMNVSGGFSFDMYPTPLFTSDHYFTNAVNRRNWIQTSIISNVGWEYRTEKSGYLYFGISFHRPFSALMKSFVKYNGFDNDERVTFDLSGNYLTLDFRYFFHEDKEKKKKKTKKPVKKDFRIKRPANKTPSR